MKTKSFAVTGVIHGSIVYASCRQEAIAIFKKHYNNERVISCNETSMS